ncbi:MAG: hypothetical protein IJ903_08200 [Ruminococcus sp.]|nr:hypothetical protein [Ruminococcus sp.]
MIISLVLNIWVFVCALFGTVYGVRNFFRPRKALYLQMITCGIASLMYARLFQAIFMFTQGSLSEGFHVGFLGVAGSFIFLFVANYGQVDGLADDKSKKFRKTRIIAIAAPLAVIGLYYVFFLLVNNTELRISVGIIAAIIICCSYYNLKHAIIYDVELGIISQMRKYNVLALCYAALTLLEYIGQYGGILPLYIITGVLNGIVAAVMIPVLKEGFDKWII